MDMTPRGPVPMHRAQKSLPPYPTYRSRQACPPCSRPANCGASTVFCILNHPSICCCTPTGMSTTASKPQRAATVGSRPDSSRPAPQEIDHLINGLQLGNLSGLHNWTKGNGLCATTVMSTTLTCTMTGMSITRAIMHSLALYVPVSA